MAGREVRVAILGDAASFIKELGLANTAAGKFFTDLTTKANLSGLALGAGLAAGAVVAGKALYDVGKQFDAAYDRIRIGSGATGKDLAGLEEDFRKVFASVPTDTQKAGDAITGLNQRLGITGDTLEREAKQFLELSRITKTDLQTNIEAVTGAFNAFGVAANDQSKFLNELFRASQATGVGVADIASQASSAMPVFKALGFSFEETAAIAAQLGKAGLSTSDVMMGFNKSLATFAKQGESAPEAFRRFIAELKTAPNDIEANQLALEVLGARGVKFAEIVRAGTFDYDGLLNKMQNGQDTIRGAAKATNDFSENWNIFKNKVLVAIEPLASQFFASLGRGMEWVNAHWADFNRGFQDAAIVIQRLWTLAEPIFMALLGQIVALANFVDDLIHGRWSQMWGDFVGILIAAFNFIIAPLRGVMDLFGVTFSDIVDIVNNGVNAVVGFLESLPGRAWSALGSLPGILAGVFWAAMGAAFDIVSSVAQSIVDAFWSIPDRVAGVGEAIANAIISGFRAAWNAVAGAINDIIPNSIGVGPLSINLPDNPLPRLAAGGIVTRPTLALIGEGGESEAVVPLSKASQMGFGGGGGVSMLTVPVYLDGRVITEVVVSNLNRVGGPKVSSTAVV